MDDPTYNLEAYNLEDSKYLEKLKKHEINVDRTCSMILLMLEGHVGNSVKNIEDPAKMMCMLEEEYGRRTVNVVSRVVVSVEISLDQPIRLIIDLE